MVKSYSKPFLLLGESGCRFVGVFLRDMTDHAPICMLRPPPKGCGWWDDRVTVHPRVGCRYFASCSTGQCRSTKWVLMTSTSPLLQCLVMQDGGAGRCMTCKRALKDGCRYCSLLCKSGASLHGAPNGSLIVTTPHKRVQLDEPSCYPLEGYASSPLTDCVPEAALPSGTHHACFVELKSYFKVAKSIMVKVCLICASPLSDSY